ncbi:PAS domain S-box protein [Candidatus Bathyarchaeota archaeon]|nr:PAS domain S-box protein [Candidatus Bathyarchaeota archaeon]
MPETVEGRYRSLLENMMNAFAYHKIVFDEDGKPVDYVFREVNKAFERLTGLKRDEIIGKKVTEVLPGIEKDPADWIGVYGMVAITGKPIRFENYARNLKKWYNVYAYSPKKGYFAATFEDITVRKELETCLFTSETKYRRLYETNRDGIVQTDRTGCIVECNKAYADMLGYSREELLDLTYQQLTPEKWRQMENEIVSQSWEKAGYSPVYEKEFVRKDCSVFPVSVRVLVVSDENGKPLEMWSIVRDITRRKQAEEAVTKEKNVLKGIMENTGAMLAYLNPEFNFVAVNSAYAKGSDHSAEELIGKNYFALFPNAENQAIFEKVRDTGKTVEYRDTPFKFANQPKRGVTYWNWTLVAVKGEKGHVQGLVLSLMETTQRKEMEQELLETLEVSQQRESEISALLKASKAVLYHSEFQHVARAIFDACKELVGASAGYVALLSKEGKENDVLFLDSGMLPCTVDPTLPMPIRGLRGETYRTGKVAYHNDFLHSKWAKLMPEGHVKLKNVLFAPLIIDNKTVGIIGLANKHGRFTERDANMALAFGEIASIALINSRMVETLEENEKRLKEYAEHLEDLVDEEANKLKDAERLAAIGETAGMVGHDIRNPLQTITSSVYLAKEEVKSLPESVKKEDLTESLAAIEDQVAYINKIVSDLQDFVKPLNPKIEDADLHKLVKDAFLSIAIPENVKVLISIEDDLPRLVVDRYLIKRVLINLITNAIQAMPDGGTVTIKATHENGMALISVEDTGLGIPEENRNKIFKPLFTTKSKGQGFGLSVCKRLVEAHNGGSIAFESEAGKGSKFTVKVPSKVRRPDGWKQLEQSS